MYGGKHEVGGWKVAIGVFEHGSVESEERGVGSYEEVGPVDVWLAEGRASWGDLEGKGDGVADGGFNDGVDEGESDWGCEIANTRRATAGKARLDGASRTTTIIIDSIVIITLLNSCDINTVTALSDTPERRSYVVS